MDKNYKVIVIGAGQAGLATGYFLRRKKHSFCLIDDQEGPGGAWLQTWRSLHLFSPAEASSLPGWRMPYSGYPNRDEVIQYFSDYEKRYGLPVHRPYHVEQVSFDEGYFEVKMRSKTTGESHLLRSRALVSATGTWQKPKIPACLGRELFQGVQLHSAQYRGPEPFAGKKVLIVGGGNSGAQLLAELSKVADCTWAVQEEPVFLPDEVDGRFLFLEANAKYRAGKEGQKWQRDPRLKKGLSAIVMIDSVKEARDRNALQHRLTFKEMWESGVVWPDGQREEFEVILWCTGFGSALDHLKGLGISDDQGRIATQGSKAVQQPGLWLVGYGNWTGWASATLMGVQRHAKAAVEEIHTFLLED